MTTVETTRARIMRARPAEVVKAAAMALAVLEGPNPTPDGDDPVMVARSILSAAFLDDDAIREALA